MVSDGEGFAFARCDALAVCLSSSHGHTAYAHELLHLFGAIDLYESDALELLFPQAIRRWLETISSGDFEGRHESIMDDHQAEGVSVDPLTARLIGWREP